MTKKEQPILQVLINFSFITDGKKHGGQKLIGFAVRIHVCFSALRIRLTCFNLTNNRITFNRIIFNALMIQEFVILKMLCIHDLKLFSNVPIQSSPNHRYGIFPN